MNPHWLEDFGLDAERGPARPLDAAQADALASKIVGRALAPAASGASVRAARTILLLVGVAGVLAGLGFVYVERADIEAPKVAEPASTQLPGTQPETTEPAADRAAESSPGTAVAEDPVPVSALPSVAPASALPADKPPAARGAVAKTPSDMLAEANRARRDHDWSRAAALYERVMGSRADESYAATVALASLRLEHQGDPRGALVLYERALAARPGGALAAQAEVGARRCRQVLGAEGRLSP